MNISNKLLAMMFTGFMLVHAHVNAAKPTTGPSTGARSTKTAETTPTAAQAAAQPAANQAQQLVGVNAANAAQVSAETQANINTITFGLREVKGLTATLAALPPKIHDDIDAEEKKAEATGKILSINAIRGIINAYLRGTETKPTAPTKTAAAGAEKVAAPATSATPAAPAKTPSPSVVTKSKTIK